MTETGIRAVFAASLRRERKARGWTLPELALKSGVSRGTVIRAEGGRDGLSLETAALLADGLGMPLAVLITEEAGVSRA